MLNPLYLVWAGAVVNLAAGLHYTYSTVRNPTGDDAQPKPNPVSWGIWSLSGWLAFFGQVTEGVRGEALLTLCVAAVPTFIFCAALVGRRRYGAYAPISRLDITCGVLAVVTLAAWRITASGSVAVALSIVCDALVAIPVIRQAYRDPSSDSPSIWVAGAVNAAITLATFRSVTFIESGFALYFLGLCLLMSFLLVVRPRLRRRSRILPRCCRGLWCPTPDRPAPNRPGRHPGQRGGLRRRVRGRLPVVGRTRSTQPRSGPHRLHRQRRRPAVGMVRPRLPTRRPRVDRRRRTRSRGYYVVDVRVRVALIGQRAPGDEPRAIVMVGSGASTHADAAAAEEIEIPLPGRSAR